MISSNTTWFGFLIGCCGNYAAIELKDSQQHITEKYAHK